MKNEQMENEQFLALFKMEVGERLRELREEKGLSQETLAGKIKIEAKTYGKYEQGKNQLPSSIVVKLAEFYNVSTDYILLGIKPRPIEKLADLQEKVPVNKQEKVFDSIVKMIEELLPLLQN